MDKASDITVRGLPLIHSSPGFVLAGRRQFFALACVLLFAASLLRYWVSYDPSDSVPHDPETFRLARNLVEKGEFANPFVPLDTGTSAIMGPAFPAFLAFLIKIFGDGSVGIYAIKWSGVILLSIQLALFPLFSSALGMGELTGTIAALVWIVAKVGLGYPHDRQPVVMFGWESFCAAFLVVIAFCCCRRYLNSSEPESIRLAWPLGLLLGALALTSPAPGIIFLGWLAWLAWKDRIGFFRKSNLVILLLPTLIVAPWFVRNYLRFGRIVFVRDNFGLELSTSNNDCAMFGIYQNLDSGCFAKVHPNANMDEARKVLADGEPKYNELRLQKALSWIRTHPAKFFNLCALRFMAFWMPPASGGPYSLLGNGRRLERLTICAMTLLSLPGLLYLYRRDRQSAVMCTISLGLFPLVYYAVQYEYRYRYPILWMTFLLGAFPIAALVRNFAEIKQRPLSALRELLGFLPESQASAKDSGSIELCCTSSREDSTCSSFSNFPMW